MTKENAVQMMQHMADTLKGRVEDKSGLYCPEQVGIRLDLPYWKLDICINDTGNLAVYPKKGGPAQCIIPLESVRCFGYELSGGETYLLINLNRSGLIRLRAL